MRWVKSNRDVLLIVLVAFGLRISLVGLLHERGYTSDEREYLSLAATLAEGKAFIDSNGEWSTKAPLWPFALSVLFRMFGTGLLIPHLLNCLLGSIAVYLGFMLCWELFEKRFVALTTAALLAVYPSLLVYSDILQTEAMYIVFVLLTFIYLERMLKNSTPLNAALFGSFAAFATLTRAVFFGFFIFLFLFLAWMYRKKFREFGTRLLMAASVWCLLLTPWTVRNYNLHGTFVPISSWGGMSLLIGNNPYATGTWSAKPGFDQWFAAKAKENGIHLAESNEIQRSALGKKLAIEFMLAEPMAATQLAIKKIYMHWIYPITNSDSEVKLQAIAVTGDAVLYSLAGFGFLGSSGIRRKFTQMFAAIVFFMLLQVVLHCEARYRLPLMPFIAIFSALGVALLVDTRRVKEFFNIRRNKILTGFWIAIVVGLYAFTAWQFLLHKI